MAVKSNSIIVTLNGEEKISLNQFIVNALSEKVSALQTVDIIEKKASKGSKEDFLDALKQIPSNEPLENDKL